jgi:hypothetical protein
LTAAAIGILEKFSLSQNLTATSHSHRNSALASRISGSGADSLTVSNERCKYWRNPAEA